MYRYVWTEKSVEEGDAVRVQEKHYQNVIKTNHEWPPALDIIFSRPVEYYEDCSKSTDDKECRDARQLAHRHTEQRRKHQVFPKHHFKVVGECRNVIRNVSNEAPK